MKKVLTYGVVMAIILAIITFVLKKTSAFDFRPYAMGILFSFIFFLLYQNRTKK